MSKLSASTARYFAKQCYQSFVFNGHFYDTTVTRYGKIGIFRDRVKGGYHVTLFDDNIDMVLETRFVKIAKSWIGG